MRKWSYDECKAEFEYIRSVNGRSPGREFNYDPKCFAEYCNMQANTIRHAGFRLIAADVANTRDVANPTYRSEARAAGRHVDGIFVPFARGIAQ